MSVILSEAKNPPDSRSFAALRMTRRDQDDTVNRSPVRQRFATRFKKTG